MTIIAISGLIGSGKDTVADYLVNVHGFRRDSFANNLKDAVSAIFGWDRQLLEGNTKKSRLWREEVDVWWAIRLGIPDLTPRWILQNIGTDVIRNSFHNDIWVASLENKLRKGKDDIVISDVRFTNEVEILRSIGAISVCIFRGPEPKWFPTAMTAKSPDADQRAAAKILLQDQFKVHRSEWDWIGCEFDIALDNNGTIDDLYTQVADLIIAKCHP